MRSTPYETRRARLRLAFLIPLGVLAGFVVGAVTSGALGLPLPLWGAVGSVAGLGTVVLLVQLETNLRLRHEITTGRRADLLDVATDAVAGAGVAGALAASIGWPVVNTTILGSALVSGVGVMWRRFADGMGAGIASIRAPEFEDGEDYAKEHELVAQGRLDEALAAFELRSKAGGDTPGPLVQAGHVLRDRGHYQRSVEYYAKAMRLPRLDARHASTFARAIWDVQRTAMNDPAAAIPHLEELVGRYPTSREVDWAWRQLTVGMVVAEDTQSDEYGAHSGHVPAVRAVERILSGAFVAGASDIHVEDFADRLTVRYRIDGLLQEAEAPPERLRSAILARLRVMAGLNPAQSLIPEDARIRVPFAGRHINLRVSTVPTLWGESLALRVLDAAAQIDLDHLGMDSDDRCRLDAVLRRRHGMVLATGPGGSGKSTTLRAAVRSISTGREKILTVEDPVEYAMDGICQASVNRKAGLTFANILRSLVRQDPDVLLVGEIRDLETAEVATHAALTGHLVLSTLHTTSAISALDRLVDMQVPDYLVVNMLEAVLAQRLVRRVCDACAEEQEMTTREVALLGSEADGVDRYRRGRGCERCRETGFRGRVGIFEVLTVDDAVRAAFLQRRNRPELLRTARSSGMHTLREDGIAKIRAGVTTPDEILRAT